jgi:hypothetical protein
MHPRNYAYIFTTILMNHLGLLQFNQETEKMSNRVAIEPLNSAADLGWTDSKLVNSSTRVILVRHGRSTYNEAGRYQGSSDDAVLTQKGKETAQLVGQMLNGMAIDAIYTSPLRRVQETIGEILKSAQRAKL